MLLLERREPHFELADRVPRKFRIAVQIVRVEDGAHVPERVSGDGGNLRLGRTTEREPGDRSAARVIESQPDNTSPIARLVERRAETGFGPRRAFDGQQNDGAFLRLGRFVERGLERSADWDGDRLTARPLAGNRLCGRSRKTAPS